MKDATDLLKSNINTTEVTKAVSPVVNIFINFIAPIICFAVSVGLGVFIIYPSYQSLPVAQAKITELESKKALLQTKIDSLKNVVDYSSVIRENSNIVNKVLVAEAAIPQLLTQIDSTALEAGLSVTRLSYSVEGAASAEDVAVATYKSVTVNLVVEGTYDQFVDFLEIVENSARLVMVENFRYGAGTSADATGKLSFTVILSSPYLYVQSDAVTDDPVDLNISDTKFVDFMEKLKKFKIYDIQVDPVFVQSASESSVSEGF